MEATIAFRVEANAEIGVGHFMRCLALAEGWRNRKGHCCFIMSSIPKALKSKLDIERIRMFQIPTKAGSVDDAKATLQIAAKIRPSWLIADGYCFTTIFQKAIRHLGTRLVLIDDFGQLKEYDSDLIIDQNLGTDETFYRHRGSNTKLLLGPRYTMLRKEFLKYRNTPKAVTQTAKKILLTIGGGDAQNFTSKVLKAINQSDLDGIELFVIAGPANPHIDTLKKEIQNFKVPVQLFVNPKEISKIMSQIDVAISSAGTTALQLAFLGVPTMVITLAENQKRVAEGLVKFGAVETLGSIDKVSGRKIQKALKNLLTDFQKRIEMSKRAQALNDGYGVDRILNHLNVKAVKVRNAEPGDCKLIWQWANDPEIRNASFLQNPISWQQHVTWFKEALKNPKLHFYIIMNHKKTAMGSVRFEITGREATISASLSSQFRNKGYGVPALRESVRHFFRTSSVKLVHAYIKPENEVSIQAFKNAGFKNSVSETSTLHHGVKTVHLTCQQ